MKKIFGSLAVLAILFSAVACGGNSVDDAIAKGSVSGKAVYDASGDTQSWTTSEITLNLTNASFAKDFTKSTDKISSVSVLGTDNAILGTVDLTAKNDIKKGDKSGTFTVAWSDDPSSIIYDGKCVYVIDPDDDIVADSGKISLGQIQATGDIQIKLKEAKIELNSTDTVSGKTSEWTTGQQITLKAPTGITGISQTGITATSSVADEKVTIKSVSVGSSNSITVQLQTATATTADQTITVTIPASALTFTDATYGVPAAGLTLTIKYSVTSA